MPALNDRQEVVNKILSALYPGAKGESRASSHPLPWSVYLQIVKHSRNDQTMYILHCLKCWLMTDLGTKARQIPYHTQSDGRTALLQVTRVISTSLTMGSGRGRLGPTLALTHSMHTNPNKPRVKTAMASFCSSLISPDNKSRTATTLSITHTINGLRQ